ncbi:MAG: TauD/TfdA family dioxygenase, partial [Pseudomonas sp.]|nr:TauD/TfdA family dioxygenase [Pseudomonas sp.]
TSSSFNYSRSDSFVTGKGEDGLDVSILDFDENGSFALRYNTYRFSTSQHASDIAKEALNRFREEIERAETVKFFLQPTTALLINNCRALHCRDVIEDNRRLLVRLFGYSRFAAPTVLSNDPLLVQG